MLLVSSLPIVDDINLTLFEIAENLFHGILREGPSDADLLRVGEGDENEGVVGENPDMIDLELFSVELLFLDILDDREALIGIDNPIPDLE